MWIGGEKEAPLVMLQIPFLPQSPGQARPLLSINATSDLLLPPGAVAEIRRLLAGDSREVEEADASSGLRVANSCRLNHAPSSLLISLDSLPSLFLLLLPPLSLPL
eukprot:753067-Hanusia_phi.AAC.4